MARRPDFGKHCISSLVSKGSCRVLQNLPIEDRKKIFKTKKNHFDIENLKVNEIK
jgi:hypothetical protein